MRLLIKLLDISYEHSVMCYCGMTCFGSRGHYMYLCTAITQIPYGAGIVYMWLYLSGFEFIVK